MLIGFLDKNPKSPTFSLSLPSNLPITPTDFARYLCLIFNYSLSFSKQISSLSSACNYHICHLRGIRYTLNLKTTSVIVTSRVHSKVDYYNSPYLTLLAAKKQIYRLNLLQNSFARSVTELSVTRYLILSPLVDAPPCHSQILRPNFALISKRTFSASHTHLILLPYSD